MMKRILFPFTNRTHARNQHLLDLLKEDFDVHICTYSEKDMPMTDVALDIANKFRVALEIKPDLVLIRGDRFELLPVAMLSAYAGFKMAQIEAGDLSGAIDNRVRYAIGHLSDYHFTTNEESEKRLLSMGFPKVYNCGSLDVEYALSVQGERQGRYILALWHNVPNEDEVELLEALKAFPDYEIIGIRGNKDYGSGTYTEQYAPDEFIRLLRGASCLVGNSSAGMKEASILGTPVVNVGSRQQNRLKPKNVMDVPCGWRFIEEAIRIRLFHGRYAVDYTYYQLDVSKKICEVIKNVLQ